MADAVIARDGDQVVLIHLAGASARGEANLASTPLAELRLDRGERTVLSTGIEGLNVFAQVIEEWKLLIAIALAGLAREAVRLASAYACERVAFGQPIGTYQGISHPLAELITAIDGGKYFTWKTIHDIATGLNCTSHVFSAPSPVVSQLLNVTSARLLAPPGALSRARSTLLRNST